MKITIPADMAFAQKKKIQFDNSQVYAVESVGDGVTRIRYRKKNGEYNPVVKLAFLDVVKMLTDTGTPPANLSCQCCECLISAMKKE